MLRTTGEAGQAEGEGDEETEEDEEVCFVLREGEGDAGGCLIGVWALSAGDGERGVGGSDEFRDRSEGMLEVELWEGVRGSCDSPEELDETENKSGWFSGV